MSIKSKVFIFTFCFGLVLTLGVGAVNAAGALDLQPAASVIYDQDLTVNGTGSFNSIKVGKQGVGGVTFFNGSIINTTTGTNNYNNPVTFADSVRIDGVTFRGALPGAGDGKPFQVMDDMYINGVLTGGGSVVVDDDLEVSGAITLASGKTIDGVDISNFKVSNVTDITASASELNVTDSGINFSELSGSASDAQISNTITASNYLPLAGGTMNGDINMGGTRNIINTNRVAIGPITPTSYPLHIQSDNYGFMQKSSSNMEIGSSLAGDKAMFGTWSNAPLELVSNGNTGIYLQNSSLNVGIGTTNPRAKIDITNSSRISTQDADRSYYQEDVIDITTDVYGWNTIKTITIGTTSGSKKWYAGMVEAWLTGTTPGQGNGVVFSRWYYDVNDAAPVVSRIGTDVSALSEPPEFRLTTSGDDILVQVRGSNGDVDPFRGTVVLKYYMPRSGFNTNTIVIH